MASTSQPVCTHPAYLRALEFRDRYEASCAAHDKGLADGTVTAVAGPYHLLFGGQPNLGEVSATPNLIPEFGVRTSDGWVHEFQTQEAAEAFLAEHAPKLEAA